MHRKHLLNELKSVMSALLDINIKMLLFASDIRVKSLIGTTVISIGVYLPTFLHHLDENYKNMAIVDFFHKSFLFSIVPLNLTK